MLFGWSKDFFKELFINISSPVPSINNVQSLMSFCNKKYFDFSCEFPKDKCSFLNRLFSVL